MSDPAPLLPYESTQPDKSLSSRSWWVYLLVAVYLLILAAMLLFPAFVAANAGAGDSGFVWLITGYACVLTLCGLSLIALPIRAIRRRPLKRSSIWPPIIASGLLAAILFFGAGIALWELIAGEHSDFPSSIFITSIAVWAFWSVLFSVIAIRSGPERIGGKLHRILIAGSVLELLIAVPSHLVVRRRTECCAGLETGLGICLGFSVMLIAFGPSVLILYYRRRKRILPPIPFDPK